MMSFVYNIVYYATLPFNAFHTLASNLPGVRNLGKISVPTRIALLVFVFLFFVLVSFAITFQFSDTSAQWSDYLLDWKTGLTVLALMIVIPIVSYYVVKIWMEEDTSDFPDIDKAWKQGLTELEKHGIPLGSTPLFLVVGNPDDRRASNLMRASGFGFNVSDPAQGPAALHWYANPDAIFIFLTQTSCLSMLADGYKNNTSTHSQLATPSPQQIPGGQTIVAGAGQQSLVADQYHDQTMGAEEDDEQRFMEAPSGAQQGVGATMDFGQGMAGGQTMSFGAEDAAKAAAQSKGMRQSKTDLTDQMERLEYVCKLINKARRPVCPINGLLVTVPFDMIEEVSEPVQMAIQSDLEVIRSTTRLRCSVTALITEMESAQGFMELIKRVGEKRAKEQRFGKGFNVWNPPIAEQLEAVSQHATGAFEDWTYLLFREKDGLRRPGNPKLFELLCKIRGRFSECMTNIIANSFGFEPDKNPRAAGNSLLFAGCYFAATGDNSDRQAFVRSVLYKVMEQDAELDWSQEALEENAGADFAANVAALIGGVCLLILIGVGINAAFGEYMPWHQDG
ncbi:type VI secretion system protein [Bremerella sp. T1]|uniref:type VI secretion system protein n=1 Tax=Bremerella sp. TYQ1 TaxID=3119568 RepID=UPI001CCAD51E|nr:type VI secretion system protein [Bremerella volcania]UBM33688.1 type VI secretion system protein [Bremerella volcania]